MNCYSPYVNHFTQIIDNLPSVLQYFLLAQILIHFSVIAKRMANIISFHSKWQHKDKVDIHYLGIKALMHFMFSFVKNSAYLLANRALEEK